MKHFYIDFINDVPHCIYFLESTRLLVFDFLPITAECAASHCGNLKFTDDAMDELKTKGLIQ